LVNAIIAQRPLEISLFKEWLVEVESLRYVIRIVTLRHLCNSGVCKSGPRRNFVNDEKIMNWWKICLFGAT